MEENTKELIPEEHLIPVNEILVGQIDLDELMAELRF